MSSRTSLSISLRPMSLLTDSIHYFLVRQNRCIELVTSQNVFDYIANGNSINATVSENVKRTRVPFVSRVMSIRKAFTIMTERVEAPLAVHRRASRCC